MAQGPQGFVQLVAPGSDTRARTGREKVRPMTEAVCRSRLCSRPRRSIRAATTACTLGGIFTSSSEHVSWYFPGSP